MSRSLLSVLESRSHDLVPGVRALLALFCARPAAHARFLNTLSLLEHIGSRKIMASQTAGQWDSDMLKHMAEEARHAFFFKRQAERMARCSLGYSSSDTVAGASAKAYMGRLDAGIAQATGAAGTLPYLYMSLIVELRAVWLYRLYQAVLDEHAKGMSLRSVLAEEELHLDAMLGRLVTLDQFASRRIGDFAASEDTRFRALWKAIEAESALPVLAGIGRE